MVHHYEYSTYNSHHKVLVNLLSSNMDRYNGNHIVVCEVVSFHMTTNKFNYCQYRKLTRHLWPQMLTKAT